jgi:hypothetical protein
MPPVMGTGTEVFDAANGSLVILCFLSALWGLAISFAYPSSVKPMFSGSINSGMTSFLLF